MRRNRNILGARHAEPVYARIDKFERINTEIKSEQTVFANNHRDNHSDANKPGGPLVRDPFITRDCAGNQRTTMPPVLFYFPAANARVVAHKNAPILVAH